MLTLFHVTGTRSVRPLWLAFELELSINIVPIDFSEDYRNSEQWRAISPAGKVPALRDGDLTLFESGAMVEHLLNQYGKGQLRPEPGTDLHAHYLQWSWFAEATLSRPVGLARMLRDDQGASSLTADALTKTENNLQALEATLGAALATSSGSDPYLVGTTFTAADIMMGYTLHLLNQGSLLDTKPIVKQYLSRLKKRPAFIRALSE